MSKLKVPITPAIRFLRLANIAFTPYLIDYVPHGGAPYSAEQLGVSAHEVIKTIVLEDEHGKGLVTLMHGDKEISTRNLARQLGKKHIEPTCMEKAQKWTGYVFGGTSPFGLKTPLPIYAETSIFDLERVFVNGGKRGLQVEISPSSFWILAPISVQVAV